MKPYAEEYQQTLNRLEVNPYIGLDEKAIIKSRKQYGANEVCPKKKKTLLVKIGENLKEPMILILLIALTITTGINLIKYMNGYETEFIECIGIGIAILLTITITLVMEGKSEKAFELLSQMREDIQVCVLREGNVRYISQNEVVVGDILLVESGDKLVADGRLVEAYELEVDESMLTGESHAIQKNTRKCNKGTVVAERTNMLYSGSFVVLGTGKIVVTEVGAHTEFGRIAEGLLSNSSNQTPLQEKLSKLGQVIAVIGLSIAILTFILQIIALNGQYTLDTLSEAFMASIVLIVAAVPEGLSTIVAASLAINVIKLAKQQTLVKKIVACETIGSVNIICSDKTGTLTENKMTVSALEQVSLNKECLFQNICINSTADLKSEKETDQGFIGNSTEGALLVYASKQGVDYKQLRSNYEVICRQPFSSELKKMTTIIEDGNAMIVLTKGSPEQILRMCELTNSERESIQNRMETYQKKAYRLIAFCHKEVLLEDLVRTKKDIEDYTSYEKNMIFDGFAAIADPLRKETFEAVAKCKEAGIEIKMLTGDNKVTATAIAKELNIIKVSDLIVEAREIENIEEDRLREILPRIRVIARSTPLIKMRVVDTLKELGNVVAVTGDGINDAPALKHADIGIAMGVSGTEVSKEASDVILLDDSFSTIVKAVEWGRGLYDNFQRFIQFQLTVNIASVLVVLGMLLLGYAAPFTPLQLLWINVIMDGPPALALGLEPMQYNLMQRKPVSRKASIVSKSMLRTIIRNGLMISLICLLQNSINFLGGLPHQKASLLFTLFMICQLFNAFNSRKLESESLLEYGFRNKKMMGILCLTFCLQVIITQYGGNLFNTVPLSLIMWIKILGIGTMVIILDEMIRLVERKLNLAMVS